MVIFISCWLTSRSGTLLSSERSAEYLNIIDITFNDTNLPDVDARRDGYRRTRERTDEWRQISRSRSLVLTK